ncbi:hypothetical protein RclHR1_01550011 [Rhizophagus clarus]|uniref:Uncharacterized protein n=1 Tax=Rhizophagus clarus TaxID=94130 RepID=A0A2Z6QF88_9GLOM|nr:hypothetical protein RclHR1_01550011 [Rhizophagus clarus]GET01164.1 hypothetical protein GLOIN_2v1673231 [Rhizophagus clarus]
MDSDINTNGLDCYNEETHPLYQLLKKQATEFELFGQRLRTEIQNSYQEFIKLQQQQEQEETNQINHETSAEFQRTQQFINELTNLGNSQTELIESLKSRVEELETESLIKNQDIKKLRQDLELNKLRIKKSDTKGKSDVKGKSDTKGKSVDIGDKFNSTDHEEIWNYEGLSWEEVMNENLLNISKSTHNESSSSNHFSSSSQFNSLPKEKSENLFIINQIHARVQKIVNNRESVGKKLKKKNFKILAKDFAINDLKQYTKSDIFKSLKENVKGHIRRLVELNMNNPNYSMRPINNAFSRPFFSQINSFPQENQEISPILEHLHSRIQYIIKQKEIDKLRVRLKHFKTLLQSSSLNNLIKYTKTNMFNSLDNNSKRLLNLLIYEALSKEFNRQNIILSQNMDEYITRGVIPELPHGYKNYIEYEKSDMFIRLNKALKARVVKLAMLEKRIIV